MRVGRPRDARRSRARASAASTRATRSAATTPGLDDALLVAVTEQPHRRRHRPARGGARGVKLIYEKSQAGRRGLADRRRPTCPVPEVPAELARKEPPRLPELAEPEVLRHFTELSTRNFGIDTGFYPLGSLHDEVQPAGQRAARRPARASATCTRSSRTTRRRARSSSSGDLQEILREVTGLDAVSLQPAAGQPGRADRADAHARLLRGPRRGRAAPEDRHPRHRARHEPGERDDGRLRADAGQDRRARQHRPRGPARQGRRAHGRADADEPVDARAVRREHRGRSATSSTAPARSCTTTART